MAEHKTSIRFFNDREVRAVWDDTHNKWWFSMLDIIAAINEQDDYQKTRNYWKYLKTKLKKENNELVSAPVQNASTRWETTIDRYVGWRRGCSTGKSNTKCQGNGIS